MIACISEEVPSTTNSTLPKSFKGISFESSFQVLESLSLKSLPEYAEI
jgi:hypothetical protein